MSCDKLVFVPVGEKVLIVVQEEAFKQEKLLEEYRKIICPHVDVDLRNATSCKKGISVYFYEMMAKLELENNWEEFPFCYLKTIEGAGKPFIYAQWKSLNRKGGSTTSRIGECTHICFSNRAFLRMQKRDTQKA